MHAQFRLSGPVGAQTRIRREDTLRTKRALSRLGFLKASDDMASPIASTAMIEGLKAFQQENGLVADGAMNQGGPTERLIQAALTEREPGKDGANSRAFGLSGSVGTGSRNRPDDVRATKRALSLVNVIPKREAGAEMAPATFNGAIQSFQRAFNLKRDGKIVPGGETERMLARAITMETGKRGRRSGEFKRVAFNETPNDVLRDFGLDLDLIGEEKEDTREVDEIEAKFHSMAAFARKLDAHFPAEMLERFLSKRGGTETLPPGKMRAFPAVQDAEELQRKRFDNDWTRVASLPHQLVSKMKDGESVLIEKRSPKGERGDPVWVREIKSVSPNTFFSGESWRLWFGSGTSKLRSEGVFIAKRVGSVVTISGEVHHMWRDTYDFDDGGLSLTFVPGFGIVKDREGRMLVAHGRAANFEMESDWRQHVSGTLEVRNGRLVNPKFKWRDAK